MPDGFEPNHRCVSVEIPAASASQGEVLERPGEPVSPAGATPTRTRTLTLFQANLLVGMLGGFWGRKSDGHPGPDLLGRGVMELAMLVRWERLKAKGAPRPRRARIRKRSLHPLETGPPETPIIQVDHSDPGLACV